MKKRGKRAINRNGVAAIILGFVTVLSVFGVPDNQILTDAKLHADSGSDTGSRESDKVKAAPTYYVNSEIDKVGYHLIWNDEFDGNYPGASVDPITGLNLNNWSYQLGDGLSDCDLAQWGNAELQCYTKSIDNIAVNEDCDLDGTPDGYLRITAKKESTPYHYEQEPAKDYTSARIRTSSLSETLFSLNYGYIEARIAMPDVQGAWPAFWMLPQTNAIYSGWPMSGEIDIMESSGVQAALNKASGALHWGTPGLANSTSGYKALTATTDNFHTFAIDWTPGKISWIFDGTVVHTASNWGNASVGNGVLCSDAPFDQPFYLLLNLAVDSGRFGGAENDANANAGFVDASMYVDYVRCYQKDGGYAAAPNKTVGPKDDWARYSGKNLMPALTATTIDNTGGAHDDASSNIGKWYFANQPDATASMSATCADITITDPGMLDYSVQLIGHFNAKAGYSYKLSFDAYAEGDMIGRNIICNAKETKSWSSYASVSGALGATSTHFEKRWFQSSDFNKCRIEFNLGAQASGVVHIRNVRLEVVDPNVKPRLASGEQIYNGTFDIGNARMMYWNAMPGTTVSIPTYTYEDLTGHDRYAIDASTGSNVHKYYERRAQISAATGYAPKITQTGIVLDAADYLYAFDMYSEEDTAVWIRISSGAKEVASKQFLYYADDGVTNIGFPIDVTEDLEDVIVEMTFPRGAKVQIDNVHFRERVVSATVPENPINGSTTWRGDSGFGEEKPVTDDGTTAVFDNIDSGVLWHAYQLMTSDFTVGNGYTYKLSFDYKIENASFNKCQMLFQRNARGAGDGAWTNVKPLVTIFYVPASADADGFVHYEEIFTCNITMDRTQMLFGFGNSGMSGDGKFTIKNWDLSLYYSDANLRHTDDSDVIDSSIFENDLPDPEPEPEEPSPEPSPAPTPEKPNKKPTSPIEEPEVLPEPEVTPEPEAAPEEEIENDPIAEPETIEKPDASEGGGLIPDLTEEEKNYLIYYVCIALFLLLLIVIIIIIVRMSRRKRE